MANCCVECGTTWFNGIHLPSLTLRVHPKQIWTSFGEIQKCGTVTNSGLASRHSGGDLYFRAVYCKMPILSILLTHSLIFIIGYIREYNFCRTRKHHSMCGKQQHAAIIKMHGPIFERIQETWGHCAIDLACCQRKMTKWIGDIHEYRVRERKKKRNIICRMEDWWMEEKKNMNNFRSMIYGISKSFVSVVVVVVAAFFGCQFCRTFVCQKNRIGTANRRGRRWSERRRNENVCWKKNTLMAHWMLFSCLFHLTPQPFFISVWKSFSNCIIT